MPRRVGMSAWIPTAVAAMAAGFAAPPHPAPVDALRPLPFLYDLYTFRGAADSTLVLASFAVPAGRLNRESVGRDVRYRFDVTLVLADTAAGTVYRTDDSVYVRLPRRPDRAHLLSTHVAVQAPAIATSLRYVVMTDATTPGVGQLYTAPFPVPDYSGDRLMVSDLALSLPDASDGWRRGGATLALLPTGAFPQSAFDVYYEVYNLPAGRPYTTEVAVERVADGDGRPVEDDSPVRVRYSGESDTRRDGTLPELRFVDAAVGEGRYRITVTVTDETSGEAAARSRTFQVNPWTPGATLVTALPRGLRYRPRPGG